MTSGDETSRRGVRHQLPSGSRDTCFPTRSLRMPKSIIPAATSIDATQRKLVVGVVIATLIAFAIVIVDLARGGRPDPPTLRARATLLDGAWRFRTGDDPHWADPI